MPQRAVAPLLNPDLSGGLMSAEIFQGQPHIVHRPELAAMQVIGGPILVYLKSTSRDNKNILKTLTTKQPDSNNIGISDNYVYVDNSNLDSESDNLYDIVFNINNDNDNEDKQSEEKIDQLKLVKDNDVIPIVQDEQINDDIAAYSGTDYALV